MALISAASTPHRELALDRAERGDRGDVDDVAAALSARDDALGIELRAEPHALQVGVEHRRPSRPRRSSRRSSGRARCRRCSRARRASRIVPCRVEEAREARCVEHVERHAERLRACAAQLRDARVDLLGAPRAEHDARTRRGEHAGEVVSESRGRARDRDGLAVEAGSDRGECSPCVRAYSNRLGMIRPLDVATSLLTTIGRLGTGTRVGTLGRRPAQPPRALRVRGVPVLPQGARSALDPRSRSDRGPCPKDGPTFRPRVREQGGRRAVPLPRRPEHRQGDVRVERHRRLSVRRVWRRTRAARARRRRAHRRLLDRLGLWRLGGGSRYRRARAPEQPLELYSFEASPFCRIVREALAASSCAYLLHNVAGEARAARRSRPARAHDGAVARRPNTGVEMFESAEIVAYLNETYAL